MIPDIYSLDSPDGIRQIVAALFLGYNYRLYTEGQTRTQLLDAYERIIAVNKSLPENSDIDVWATALKEQLEHSERDLGLWLLGLTNKTAQNLGVTSQDNRLDFLTEMVNHISEATENRGDLDFNDAMLMIWAGAATLTVR